MIPRRSWSERDLVHNRPRILLDKVLRELHARIKILLSLTNYTRIFRLGGTHYRLLLLDGLVECREYCIHGVATVRLYSGCQCTVVSPSSVLPLPVGVPGPTDSGYTDLQLGVTKCSE